MNSQKECYIFSDKQHDIDQDDKIFEDSLSDIEQNQNIESEKLNQPTLNLSDYQIGFKQIPPEEKLLDSSQNIDNLDFQKPTTTFSDSESSINDEISSLQSESFSSQISVNSITDLASYRYWKPEPFVTASGLSYYYNLTKNDLTQLQSRSNSIINQFSSKSIQTINKILRSIWRFKKIK